MNPAVAIVGMACEYPGARSPEELWEDALARRRAFRRLPPGRLRPEDYLSDDPAAPDRTYAAQAAVLADYQFDRVGFRVSGPSFRSADLAHWLALDVAARTLADAGFAAAEGAPRASTGVFVGNTLTGEFSRAGVLRLRWPFVRRVVEASLVREGWPAPRRRAFLDDLERRYKEPFPPVGEETLAGGLSNTIAGRICNHFDLNGGGYTLDGACASSLLAVAHACTALAAGDLDLALAGGVDLSLDPFELVGFAKAGALAAEEMRVFDARSAGFWPGEGCGFVALMRLDDARASGRRVVATIRGWGISSDGRGGLTRPEVDGQLLALRRAYRRAGFGVDTVVYFEGHGTGTAVGDATELRALSCARREADPAAPRAAVGSIKANIGHTKAAAGVAGLIKAALALRDQVLPPTTACDTPHPELSGPSPALRVLPEAEPWPADRPLRAGVSAMGFGGINVHLALEGTDDGRDPGRPDRARGLSSSAQDAELFLVGGRDADDLRRQVDHLCTFAADLSRAELGDLAAVLAQGLGPRAIRAAVVAARPAELADRLGQLRARLVAGESAGVRRPARLGPHETIFLGSGTGSPRIGLLFPGQGSPAHRDGGAWRLRFASVRTAYESARLPDWSDDRRTDLAQPAIVLASLAALGVLESCGIEAEVAVGHSLGELSALHWVGVFDAPAVLRIATARGRAVARLDGPAGAMAGIAAGPESVAPLLDGEPAVIAGLNGPRQTVVSGPVDALARVLARARSAGLPATLLPVSHAFHSPLMAAAAPALADALAHERVRAPHPRRALASTITGARLGADDDIPGLLLRQLTAPVRFHEALASAGDVDLWIEAGPGRVFSRLVAEISGAPSIALDAGGPSLAGLLCAAGAAFALGAPLRPGALFADRFTRPFDLGRRPCFLTNPCEMAPVCPDAGAAATVTRAEPAVDPGPSDEETRPARESAVHRGPVGPPPAVPTLDLLRLLLSERVELPPAAIAPDSRLLGDLHLNSIAVGALVVEAARRLGLPPPAAPTHYAAASVAELAHALDELAGTGESVPSREGDRHPAGVDSWVRPFAVALEDEPLPARPSRAGPVAPWQILAPADHPLAGPLRRALGRTAPHGGVAVCLPPGADEAQIPLLLEAARALTSPGAPGRFLLVQHGGGGAAFARTLHLEAPHITTCVVDAPPGHPAAADWAAVEAGAARGFVEAHYDPSGRRRVPVLRPLPAVDDGQSRPPLGPGDVLLITGGGKGIAAECGLALARATGCRLALLGRSRREADAELAANLRRFDALDVPWCYHATDVTDPEAVRNAVRAVEAGLGPVTALIHGAGTNVPRRLADLDAAAFTRTLAPKVRGLGHLLDAIEPGRLRLLVAFGSIIARIGLPGEADYALANDWLARLTEQFQVGHPSCRCLTLEWSIWSGVGMGERPGRVDALAREGIAPIPPDAGVAALLDLIARPLPVTSVVVAGRFGAPPTLRLGAPPLPPWRFLERPRVYYPGVELVIEAEPGLATDPYLNDHIFRGECLFPAVLGLEAMAQAAAAVAGSAGPIVAFEEVRFDRPVAVPEGRPTAIRLAALDRGAGRVEVALRGPSTAFQADHFRAIIRPTCREPTEGLGSAPVDTTPPEGLLPLDPARDLYGSVLFHGGRFRRLVGYRHLEARACVAEIGPSGPDSWFGRLLPPELLLGDPGARDAAIHAIQGCIPHLALLPTGADRIVIDWAPVSGRQTVRARECSSDGETFIYDLEISDESGRVRERWEGLRLRAVRGASFSGPWPAPLLGPYLERRLAELWAGASVAVALEQDETAGRGPRGGRALWRARRRTDVIHRRPDGKPEAGDGAALSVSHAGDLTLAVAGAGPLGCDLEPVADRPPAMWRDLLGPERFVLAEILAREVGEDLDTAATRVWSVGEALGKAGAAVGAPLVLASAGADRWALLATGSLITATFATPLRGRAQPLVIAICGGRPWRGSTNSGT